MSFWSMVFFALVITFIAEIVGRQEAIISVLVIIAFNLMELNIKIGGGK